MTSVKLEPGQLVVMRWPKDQKELETYQKDGWIVGGIMDVINYSEFGKPCDVIVRLRGEVPGVIRLSREG